MVKITSHKYKAEYIKIASIALALAGIIFFANRAIAAEPTPGTACATLGEVVYAGGPGEAGHFLSCNGSQYVSILGYDTSGRSLIQIATDTTACSGAIYGRMRYTNATNTMEVCNGTCWLRWGEMTCDSLPNAFSFNDLTNQALSTLFASNIVLINGISGSVTTTLSGASGSPQYRICNDSLCAVVDTDWTNAGSLAANGQYVQLRMTSAPTHDTAYNVTLNVGTGSDTWTITTVNDTSPDSFTFTDQTGVPLSNQRDSNIVQITGITGSVSASISGNSGQFQVCSNAICSVVVRAFSTASTTITNGQYIQLRQTSSGSYDTALSTTFTVGSGSDNWSVTTQNDNTPNGFNFTDLTNASLSNSDPSNILQITGITGSVSISISGNGGTYRICNDGTCSANPGYTSGAGTITNGQYVQLRQTSSGSFSTAVGTTLTIGTVSDTWYITTRGPYNCTSEPAFGTVAHNATVTGWTAATSNNCAGISTTRTCYDGTLNNGGYSFASCNNNCDGAANGVAWAGWVTHGNSITAYPASTSNNCAGSAVNRTCSNGTLNNAGNNVQTCNNNCDGATNGVAWAGWVTHGNSINAYSTSSVPCGSSCPGVVSRTCSNGTLSNGGNNAQSCSVAGPTATTFSVTPTSFNFTGGSQGPTITPTPGGATWSVSAGTASASAIGSYNVTATATGCYTGTSGSVGWTINATTCPNSGGCTAGPYANGATCTTYSTNDNNSCASFQRVSTCSGGVLTPAPYTYASCTDSCMNAFTFPTTNNAPIGGWVESGYGQATGFDGAGCGFDGPSGAQARVCTGAGTGCGAWENVGAPGYGPDGMAPNTYAQFRYIPPAYSSSYNMYFGCGGCGAGGSWTINTQATPYTNATIYNYTGSDQTFTVPAGITSVRIKVWGAAGGNGFISTGGNGGFSQADVAVTPGQNLTVIVGMGGTYELPDGIFYGGGAGSGWGGSGGGGGRSEVTGPGGWRVIAGGGGGGGDNNGSGGSSNGGQGGGANQNGGQGGSTTAGCCGCQMQNDGGWGGTLSGGGPPAAEAAWCATAWSDGGDANNGGCSPAAVGQASGCGGGGYYGGGQGSGRGAGGGGGSGYAGGTGVSNVSGSSSCNTGDADYGGSACLANGNHGRVVIRY